MIIIGPECKCWLLFSSSSLCREMENQSRDEEDDKCTRWLWVVVVVVWNNIWKLSNVWKSRKCEGKKKSCKGFGCLIWKIYTLRGCKNVFVVHFYQQNYIKIKTRYTRNNAITLINIMWQINHLFYRIKAGQQQMKINKESEVRVNSNQ